MSPIVAVAGGTGSLGRTIVEAIISAGKFEVVILARKTDEEKEKEIGARIIQVDYTSVEGLTKILEDNRIHTVLSVVNTWGDIQPELNLVAAADKASTTKRYVPSIWAVEYTEEFAAKFPVAQGKADVCRALESTGLEYTSWLTGYFADYYLAPPVKSNMTSLTVAVDVTNNVAAIPGSGDVPVVFTYTADVAEFVAASLSLPKWETKTHLIGDKLTWNELVALAENVKGVKFDVTYDSVVFLKTGKITELPGQRVLYPMFPKEVLQGILSVFGLMFDGGIFNWTPEHTIDQDFPDIKVNKMKDLMARAWAGK